MAARKTAPKRDADRNIRSCGKPRPIDIADKGALNYEEAASYLGMGVGALRRLVRSGRGPAVAIIGKHHRFRPRKLDEWVGSMEVAA